MANAAVAEPPAPPSGAGAGDAAPAAPPSDQEVWEPTKREQSLMLHLSNVSHAVNHFQNQMLGMLYPYIMADLGMSYAELAVMSAVRSVFTSISQGTLGFLTPFVSRCKILGFANFGIALGTFMSGIAGTFPFLVLARCVSSVGSSAQHPIGFSILSSYFPKTRGSAIAINNSASNVGTLVATPVATALLLVLGWRQIFFVVAFASIIMGGVYLLFRDYGAPSRGGSGGAKLRQGLKSYWRVLQNRNMLLMGLVFMVGAAGAEFGINQTYFAPHLANDFGYSALLVGVLITAINIGQVGGPVLFGWLSDRMSRVMVLQTSLGLSILTTLWVAWTAPGEFGLPPEAFVAVLFIGLMIYSAVTSSRGTLTQTIVADLASDEDRDAAFSMYFFLGFFAQPFWLLVTGLLMDNAGWGWAMSRLSISYILAIGLLFLLKDPRKLSRTT
jgi:predicted MFS family arabinose efflux permease